MTEPATADGQVCSKCGAFGSMPHSWVESDCVLPHKNHSPAKIGHCCTWCVDRHKEWLREILDLYATLDQVLEPGSIPDDTAEHGHQKKKPASPAPVRLEAWAMLYDADRLYRTGSPADLPDIPAVLTVHAQALWDDLGYGQAPTTVSGAASTLTANADTVAGRPWIDEYDADLRWLRKALRTAHGISDPKPLFPCISVDCTGMVWRQGEGEQPKCRRCGRLYGKLDIVRARAMVERETA